MRSLLIIFMLCLNGVGAQTKSLVLDSNDTLIIEFRTAFKDKIVKVIEREISFNAKINGYGKPKPLNIHYFNDFKKQIGRRKYNAIKKSYISYYVIHRGILFYITSLKKFKNEENHEKEYNIKATLYSIYGENDRMDLIIINKILDK